MQALYDVPAPAKLNLFLHITGRRADGYHLLQSVFMLIDWCDTLHFELRPDGHITRGPGLIPSCRRPVRASSARTAASHGLSAGRPHRRAQAHPRTGRHGRRLIGCRHRAAGAQSHVEPSADRTGTTAHCRDAADVPFFLADTMPGSRALARSSGPSRVHDSYPKRALRWSNPRPGWTHAKFFHCLL